MPLPEENGQCWCTKTMPPPTPLITELLDTALSCNTVAVPAVMSTIVEKSLAPVCVTLAMPPDSPKILETLMRPD